MLLANEDVKTPNVLMSAAYEYSSLIIPPLFYVADWQ